MIPGFTPELEKVLALKCDGTHTASNCALQAWATSGSSLSVSSMLRLTRMRPRRGSPTASSVFRHGSRRPSGVAHTPANAAWTTRTRGSAGLEAEAPDVVVEVSESSESSWTSIKSSTERMEAGQLQVSTHLLHRTRAGPSLPTSPTNSVTASISMPVHPHSLYHEIRYPPALEVEASVDATKGAGEGEVLGDSMLNAFTEELGFGDGEGADEGLWIASRDEPVLGSNEVSSLLWVLKLGLLDELTLWLLGATVAGLLVVFATARVETTAGCEAEVAMEPCPELLLSTFDGWSRTSSGTLLLGCSTSTDSLCNSSCCDFRLCVRTSSCSCICARSSCCC
mmetsp:Transcript_65583/g.211561  ORF Transcript_65583/g.211561 Transcript_65583/m.211561 type:complete len:339 (-) Transcript_65583:513-1529(-)